MRHHPEREDRHARESIALVKAIPWDLTTDTGFAQHFTNVIACFSLFHQGQGDRLRPVDSVAP